VITKTYKLNVVTKTWNDPQRPTTTHNDPQRSTTTHYDPLRPKPDESFELHKLRQENEDYRCQNENLLRENAEKTERMNNLAYILYRI
jgi:hypothetical protein